MSITTSLNIYYLPNQNEYSHLDESFYVYLKNTILIPQIQQRWPELTRADINKLLKRK